ncbi:MAG: plasmid stabilization protein [Gaiellales bacterium]
MPPRGLKKGTKRARQYEHIKESAKERGASTKRAKELAARTVQKERARSGESKTPSRSSLRGKSPSVRGGQRSGTDRPKGQTREQLYNQAKRLNIRGRSKMTKSQLQRAIAGKS